MDLIDCPHCGTQVFASIDQECPACRKALDAPSEQIDSVKFEHAFKNPLSTSGLVTVARFVDSVEASLAKNCLEDAGISAFLADAETATMAWQISNALGGVKLQVAAPDAYRARVVLEEQHDASPGETKELVEEALAARVEPWEEPPPEEDGSDDDEPEPTARDNDAERAFRGAIFGLWLFPLQFYVTYLLLAVLFSNETLASRPRNRAVIASVINTPYVLAFFALLWTIIGLYL
jgi:Putative prokaryotic signal transducing protein